MFGPTGSGKSTLCALVAQHLTDTLVDIQRTTGYSTPLVLDALASESKSFGWKDFYKQWIVHLCQLHPDINIDIGVEGVRRTANGTIVINERVSVYNLREAATLLTRQVKPVAILIDEAPHIKKLASGEHVSYQMDVLKSLIDRTGTVFVLVGTYEMLDMINQNGQQGRRSRDVHLHRYTAQGTEWDAFRSILNTLQDHLPVARQPNLVRMATYLYKGCLGCVGILVPWLSDTLTTVLKAGKQTITKKDLEAHKLEPGKRLQIAHEINEGETKLANIEEKCDAELDMLLGI
ncbi:MAG: ATP-binding protein, partial [Chloroflexota bacterium]|nr:ATP-binding protein [Chloroflexota bacterium]